MDPARASPYSIIPYYPNDPCWFRPKQNSNWVGLRWAHNSLYHFNFFCLIKYERIHSMVPLFFQNPSNSCALTLSSFLMLTSTNDFLHYWTLNIPISLSLSLSLGFVDTINQSALTISNKWTGDSTAQPHLLPPPPPPPPNRLLCLHNLTTVAEPLRYSLFLV